MGESNKVRHEHNLKFSKRITSSLYVSAGSCDAPGVIAFLQ